MITIEEREPCKLSGLSSLFISFDFDAEVVNAIKKLDKYVYDKKTFTWEVPTSCLAVLLDTFTYLDDITLILKKDKESNEYLEPKIIHKTPPFDHQKDAITFGLNREEGKGFLLLDQPGLGKALDLDTLIITTKGKKKLRDITKDDVLFDEEGHECNIKGIFDHDSLEMYDICFYPNDVVRCCKDHLWPILTPKEGTYEIVPTWWLLENYRYVEMPLPKQRVKSGWERNTRTIKSIKYAGNFPGRCLTVDSPNKLYLIDNYILTHNTTSMIYLAEELQQQKGLEHCLIICGINTLKANWKKEIQKFSTLPVRVIGEKLNKKGNVTYASMKERAAELINPIKEFFIVINIEMLRNDDIIQAIRTSKNKIDMIVLDECHKCSGISQQSQHLLKLKDYKYKIGLTGTLLTNSPLSAYIPLKWIGMEHSNFTNFKSQYCVYGGFGGHQIVGYKNIDMLKDVIDECSLRRTKDMLNIPPKTLIKEVVELDERNRKFYDNVKDGVKEECDKVELKAGNVLALTTRLRQATACPSALTTEKIVSSKLNRAVELAEDIISQGEKVVIMCIFKESVIELKELLKQYNPLIGTGDVKDDVVSNNIDKFQNDSKYKVFIATTAKCGTGITLNAATYLICVDIPWTWALFEQVQDRIHRVTNTKPVFIYELICQDTIDEAVANIVETKKAFSDFIVDDKADEKSIDVLRQYIQDL